MQERASPRELALSLALGALIGTSPLVGLHMVVAVPLATLLRLNRGLTIIGTNFTIGPLVGLVVAGEVLLGAKLLGRELPALSAANALDVAKGALGAWWLGFAVVGPSVGALVALLVYPLARWRARHVEEKALRQIIIEQPVKPP